MKFKKASIDTHRTSLLNVQQNNKGAFVVDNKCLIATKRSESLVTRALEKRDMKMITIECDIPALSSTLARSPEEREIQRSRLSQHLEAVINNGFNVGNTHYAFFQFGPGDQRNAQEVFVSGTEQDRIEVMQELTTLDGSTPDLTPEAAFAKDGKALFSKVFAREAHTGASSIPIRRMSHRAADVLNTCKVIFTDDIEGSNRIPYHNPLNTDQKGDIRPAVTTDGMWLFGRKIGLCFALANGSVTEETFEHCLELLEENIKLKAQLADKEDKKTSYQIRKNNAEVEKVLAKAKMPAFVQTRLPGGMKGAAHFADIDQYAMDDCDAVVFKSVRKFKDKDWNGRLGDLEICNQAHAGSGWVNMSAPVISALVKAPVNIMHPVVEYWIKKIEAVFDGNMLESSKAIIDLMGAMSSRETEDDEDNRMLITKALQANVLLARDHHMWAKVQDKIRAFVTRMAAGKLAVPGAYPYISVDPNHAIVQLINRGVLHGDAKSIPTMKSGEYYFNGEKCRAMMARSPLTHPNQVKVVSLNANRAYHLYNNVLILNAIDGIWIDMSGADMDGDEAMLALETKVGAFPKDAMTAIMDCVSNEPVLNYEEGLSGKEVPFTQEERVKYLVANAKRSQVGMLNDAYSAWLEIYTHLRNLLLVFDAKGCNEMKFVDTLGESIFSIDGKSMTTRSMGNIVPAGIYARKDILAIAKRAWANVTKLEIYQSREVDAPKTGVGVPESIVQAMTTSIISYSMLARRYSKGKYGDNSSHDAKVIKEAQTKALAVAQGKNDKLIGYRALTPLGYVTDTVSYWWDQRKSTVKVFGKSHAGYLFCLLTDDERLAVSSIYGLVNNIKKEYTASIQGIMQDASKDDEAKSKAKRDVMNDVTARLIRLGAEHDVPAAVVAAAAYFACYLKDGSASKGLAFAWLLDSIHSSNNALMAKLGDDFVISKDGYLLSIFKRGDMLYRYVNINVETYAYDDAADFKGYVFNNTMHIEDQHGMTPVRSHWKFVDNQNFKVEYSSKGRLSAFVRAIVDNVVDPHSSTTPITNGKTLVTVVNTNSRGFMDAVKAHDGMFAIILNDEGKTVAKVGNEIMADVQLSQYDALNLLNKQVRWVHNDPASKEQCTFDKYQTSIKHIAVRQVGSAK